MENLVAASGKAVVETTVSSAPCDLIELGNVRPEKLKSETCNIQKFRKHIFCELERRQTEVTEKELS